MRRMATGLAVLALVVAVMGTAAAAPAGRTVIEVFPGPNAINDALAIANPGDTLNIHTGTYTERARITTKSLTLRAAGDGPVTVDAGCARGYTIDVAASGVTLRGLRVIGSAGLIPIEVNFSHVATGRIIDSTVEDTCGNAEYGVNVFQAGSIQIVRVTATGFADAGIYIGAITDTPNGPLLVSNNESFGNERGIIVENSAGGEILVRWNNTHDNFTTGIWITNSNGVHIQKNTVTDNNTAGIDLDGLSNDNLIRRNVSQGHTFDLANEGGVGNCFLDNTYTTSFGDVGC
jgi:nitrous oxidase accessory protein NosD